MTLGIGVWIGTLAIITGTGAAAVGAQQRAPSLVFEKVTVVDVAEGKLVPSQRVVIVGNRIRAVGPARRVAIPRGARVVDAQGKYLIPGLWDMHVHLSASPDIVFPLFLANGITGLREASVQALGTLKQRRREILAGTRVGPPRQVLSGVALDGPSSDCTRSGTAMWECVADAADARHVIDSLKAAGAEMIKMHELSRELYFAIAAAARRVGIPFGGHATTITAIEASDSGASLLDHPNSAGDLFGRCLATTATVQQCRLVAERFRRNHTWWVPTLAIARFVDNGGGLSASIDGPVHLSVRPVTDTVLTRFFDYFTRRLPAKTDGFFGDSAFRRDPLDSASLVILRAPRTDSLGMLRLAMRVGLPILAATDASPLGGIFPGYGLHVELATMVAEGLTSAEALRTATLYPAQFLRATDSLGTVAPGKLADLVLLDADPLADITHTQAIRAVVANGRYFDRSVLDQILLSFKRLGFHGAMQAIIRKTP